MRTYYILAIGNSFSEDATHFLYDIAAARGIQTKVVNLYIGGCSLERHWKNIENETEEYEYQLNGKPTDHKVSIQQVLREETWDWIITQQCSHDSGWKESYEPFLGWIVEYLKKEVPQAKLFLQETWAYEKDSSHDCFARYHRNQEEMYIKLKNNYYMEAKKHGLELIPCGDVIQRLRQEKEFDVNKGGISLCRDGFHMNYFYGRYALSYTWFRCLLGPVAGKDKKGRKEKEPQLAEMKLLLKICEAVEEICG